MRLLALAVAEPDAAWTAELTGKKGTDAAHRSTRRSRPSPCSTGSWTFAREVCATPLGSRRRPREPSRCRQCAATTRLLSSPRSRAADSEWAGRFPERDDRWWALLLGPQAPLDRLDHLSTLSYWAPRVWGPLLQAKGRRS